MNRNRAIEQASLQAMIQPRVHSPTIYPLPPALAPLRTETERDREHATHIRHIIDEFTQSQSKHDRALLAIRLFEYLNRNPDAIHMKESLCDVILRKINDFQHEIHMERAILNGLLTHHPMCLEKVKEQAHLVGLLTGLEYLCHVVRINALCPE